MPPRRADRPPVCPICGLDRTVVDTDDAYDAHLVACALIDQGLADTQGAVS